MTATHETERYLDLYTGSDYDLYRLSHKVRLLLDATEGLFMDQNAEDARAECRMMLQELEAKNARPAGADELDEQIDHDLPDCEF